jgi:hypothetical protein
MTDFGTYKVEPAHKKCVNEVFYYTHPDFKPIEITENYRWGEFHITPTSEEEVFALFNNTEDEFIPSDFEDYEAVEIWDCCARDEESTMPEEELDTLREETEELDHWQLEERGWQVEFETCIYGGIKVEKIDG